MQDPDIITQQFRELIMKYPIWDPIQLTNNMVGSKFIQISIHSLISFNSFNSIDDDGREVRRVNLGSVEECNPRNTEEKQFRIVF